MKGLPTRAAVYVLGAIAAGLAVLVWAAPRLIGDSLWLTLGISLAAALTQILKVEGPTQKSSYNIALALYWFAFVALGLPEALLVMLIASGAEWMRHRYPWYIQSFNIASLAVALWLARVAEVVTSRLIGPEPAAAALGLVLAGVTLIAVNHTMVGLVIWFARGENLRDSGVFGRMTLGIDAALLGLGATTAYAWTANPYIAALAIVPAYLLYTALRIPALERQAVTDAKTGLYNAQHFAETLQKELDRADRGDLPLTVVVCDLDLLRDVNNRYGHLAGDIVLGGVADILRRETRDYDVVARMGGEEFAILMAGTVLTDAIPRIERIREEIERSEFAVPSSLTPIHVTMSFGVAERTRCDMLAKDLVNDADTALYAAKYEGRNRVRAASDIDLSGMRMPYPDPVAQSGVASASLVPPSRTHPVVLEYLDESPAPGESETAPPGADMPGVDSDLDRRESVRVAVVCAIALAALGLTALTPAAVLPADRVGLLAFALVAAVTEMLSIDIYVRDSSVSTSGVLLLAGTLEFGLLGGGVIALTIAGAAMVTHRSPLNRFAFNASTQLTSVVAVCWLMLASQSLGAPGGWAGLLVLSLLAAFVLYGLTTVAVSWMVQLDEDAPLGQIWSERFGWLWAYYLAFGVAAFALAWGYRTYGLLGLGVFTVPLMVLRVGQEQYLSRTRELVKELRANNQELERRSIEILRLNDDLLRVLANAVDLRDPLVLGHSLNVARYAAAIADELGLSPERRDAVYRAGLLHDVGKLGIEEEILQKPSRLTRDEYDVIKRHAGFGARLISDAHALSGLMPAIRHHHERFDGRGYPDGLAGTSIPLEARIIGLADAVEAMASDRPYCAARPLADILEEALAHSGTQFDPEVVEAFRRVVERDTSGLVRNSTPVAAPTEPVADESPVPVPKRPAAERLG